uniref:Homeobox domain-containing protein n=1 Tax=Panagrolaimus davidi TaxID=227884 RepID=A0A914QX47_9BILA
MDAFNQQISQLLFLQSLAFKNGITNNLQFRQMPSLSMDYKIPPSNVPTTPSPSVSESEVENMVSKILSAHQNLKSEIPQSSYFPSPLSSPKMPFFNSNTIFQSLQNQQSINYRLQSLPYQSPPSYQLQKEPEYRLAVTRESSKPLQEWMNKNLHHPYPTLSDIQKLSNITGFTKIQIRNWFTNNRRRIEQEYYLNKPLPWMKKSKYNQKSPSPQNISQASTDENVVQTQTSENVSQPSTDENVESSINEFLKSLFPEKE